MLNIINSDLEIDLREVAIDCTHRVVDTKKNKKKARPIIAKFVRYYHRKEVLCKKKYLKGKGIPITENLTSFKMKKLERSIVFFSILRSMVLSCLEMEIISQAYIMINWRKHYGKRIHSFFCVIRDVICSYSDFCGNFVIFFQSNDKWEYTFNANSFISNFTFYYFLTQSYFFSLQEHITYFFTDSQNNLFSFILIVVRLLKSIYDE